MARVKPSSFLRNRFGSILRATSPGEISFFGENPALTQLRRAKSKLKPNAYDDDVIANLKSVDGDFRKPEIITSPEQQPGFVNFKQPKQSSKKPKVATSSIIATPKMIANAKMLADAKSFSSRNAKIRAASSSTRRGVDTGMSYNVPTGSEMRERLMNQRDFFGVRQLDRMAEELARKPKKVSLSANQGTTTPPLNRTNPRIARNQVYSSSKSVKPVKVEAVDTGMSYDVPTASSAGSVQRTRPPRKAHEYREAMVGALNSGNKSEANRLYGEAVERALKRGDKDEAELIKNTYWGTVRGEPIAPRQDVKNLRETFDDAYNFAQRNRGDASAQAEVNRLRGLLAEEKLRQWKRNNRAIDTGMSYNVKNLDESVADAVAQRNRGVAGAQDEVNRLRPYLFQEYIDRATRRADVENEPGMSISALSPQEQRAVRRKMVNALGSNEYSSIPEYTRVSNAKKRMTKRSIKKADYFVNNAPSRLSPGELGDMRRKNFLAGKSPINDVNIFGWENSQKKDADKWAQYIDRLSLIDFKPFYFAQNTSPFDSVYGNSMRQEPASMLTSNKKMYQSAYGPLKPGSTRGSTAMKRLSKRQAGPKPDKYF